MNGTASSLSLFQRATAADLITDPFPHIVIHNALPDDLYQNLSKSFPLQETVLKGKEPGSNKRFDFLVSDLEAVGGVDSLWAKFLSYHASKDFFNDVVRIFGSEIERRYPSLQKTFGSFASWKTGVRKRDAHQEFPLLMDAHISINTPVVEKPTSVRAVHVDDPRKLYGGLFYMRRPGDTSVGADLLIYKWKRQDYKFDRQHTFEKYVEVINTVSYDENTLIFFLNSIDSLHGVTPRQKTSSVRTFVNLVVELKDPLFDLESRQIGALHKRLRKLLNPSVYAYK